MNRVPCELFVSGCLLTALVALVAGCRAPSPAAHPSAEVTIAPVLRIASSRRGAEHPPAAPASTETRTDADLPTDEDRDRDPRIRRMPRAILVAEAEQLGDLHAHTTPRAPDFGLVMLRLGHAHGAVEAAAWQEGDKTGATSARREALAVYERFLRELPKHDGTPEALYFAGLEEERDKRLDNARKHWFTVIILHPTHKLVPACYYGFGVLFRAEAVDDASKLSFAEQSFREVVKRAASPLAQRAQRALDDASTRPDEGP